MLFNTPQYAIFFLIVLGMHWGLPELWRRPFLLLASYYFYASAIPQYLLLILGLTAFNYAMGLWIARSRAKGRTRLLWAAIAGNLGSLAYFKYSQLILSTLQPLLKSLPLLGTRFSDPLLLNILLPLGISFFVFEFIHYAVEVWRGHEPIRSPVDLALFAAFFPTQIAGPIKRFPDFVKQLRSPLPLRAVDFEGGFGLILRGLLKKVVVADTLAPVVAEAFAHPAVLGPGAAWFATFAFATQLYCDFSGYTDIGRGCAILLGYGVPENFRSPYQAANPAEFWHRWHISLSSWLRAYLFIPLGGSRVPAPRLYLNLMITMSLGGLWHGASWHFLVWGAYQGALLCAHRLWQQAAGSRTGATLLHRHATRSPTWSLLASLLTRPLTLLGVCVGWALFRAATVADAIALLRSMLALSRPAMAGLTFTHDLTPVLLLFGAALIVVAGWVWSMYHGAIRQLWRLASEGSRIGFDTRLASSAMSHLLVPVRRQLSAARAAALPTVALRCAVYTLAIVALALWPQHTIQPFIYFQF